jgi:anti-anti-sigma regulatory factor
MGEDTVSYHAASAGRVALADGLTLQTVQDGAARLREAYAQGGPIEIDCAAADECDLSGAQLIIAALKTADRDGRQVRLVPPSSGALQRTLSRAGLTETYEGLVAACAQDGRAGRERVSDEETAQ